jgi:DNA modification methylase
VIIIAYPTIGAIIYSLGEYSMTDYQEFLKSKFKTVQLTGFEVSRDDINDKLFLYQKDIVRWALRLGKAAIFAERGLGKTAMQTTWAQFVARETGKPVIILAPLAVAAQTVREGAKFDVPVTSVREMHEVGDSGIYVTNYERIEKFDMSVFGGVVLDESSILKSFTGKTKRLILDVFQRTQYKLACTATPAPNDHMELGNHAEFLNIMPSNEMLSRWFINDTMQAGGYRLKHHAAGDFWRWLTSWAVYVKHPRDLGTEYDMPGFDLPQLHIIDHLVETSQVTIDRVQSEGMLLAGARPTATELHKVKRESLPQRIAEVRNIIDSLPDDEPVILWCYTNDEADALKREFPDAAEVRGSDKPEHKERDLLAFTDGEVRLIITKPEIAGWGLNWQHCAHQVFSGLSFSFETWYQAVGRSHRFGQDREVHVHMVYSQSEDDVLATLRRKHNDFEHMQQGMNTAMSDYGLFRDGQRMTLSQPDERVETGDNWTMYLGDCVDVTAQLPDDSIDFCIHSPPFSNLYIYSDSERDMGNANDDDEFFKHYEFLIDELYRVTAPGRLCAVHCKDLPAYMNRDGAAGLRDFPGDIIRSFASKGWQYHSRVTIWKDPVIEMQRTKNHGLLHKNFVKESNACRQGMPDYLIVFRKYPLDGQEVVTQRRKIGDYIGTNPPQEREYMRGGKRSPDDQYSIAVWQRYASPVWYDIDQTNVLNFRQARDNQDEKHICPLQLDVIAKSIDLWTNAGDVVFSPFAGIGSEGYKALQMGRKFVGVELKESYFDVACKYLKEAEMLANQPTLFDLMDATGD